MKNDKIGFTLIELLAVIVILAVISLIAVPIVLNIVGNAKENANKRSIDMYEKSLKNAIADYYLKESSPENIVGEYTTESIEALLLEKGVKVEYDGERIVCQTIIINKNKTINVSNCTIGGKTSLQDIICDTGSCIPREYQRVEYIESTSNQYIDTKVSAGMNIGIKVEFAPNSVGTIFGAITSKNVGYFGVNLTSKFELYWERSIGQYYFWNKEEKYIISLNYLNNKTFLINDEFIKNINANPEITSSNIYLFKLNDPTNTFTQFIKSKLYYVEITSNNEIINQFVPCYRIEDEKPGLNDLVNNDFLTNSGNGEDFAIGPDI